ncbi:citryl-CoA lyase [Amycolatopsis lurida]
MTVADTTAWWSTAITRVAPGEIELRGYPIEQLIGKLDFVSAIWLLTQGSLPTEVQSKLLEAALVASVDHGPQAPSIASARMAATCGGGLNSAMANGINVLGDTHGGAGQQCVAVLNDIVDTAAREDRDIAAVASEVVAEYRSRKAFIPGFGHRFHPRDPRRDPLLALVGEAVDAGELAGNHLRAGLAVEQALKPPINIDGITAIIYAELGVSPELARGYFALARSVGILAHAWEETGTGRRVKGPLPPPLLADYTGEPPRRFPSP